MTRSKLLVYGFGLWSILLLAAAAWACSVDVWKLQEFLKSVSPLSLEINFFLIILGFLVNIGNFRSITGSLPRRGIVYVLAIAISATAITMFAAPRTHRIFYDEDIYLNIGQNIANTRQAGMCNEGGWLYGVYFCDRLEYNKQPNGWPFLISLLYRAIGESHLAAHLLNNAIWGISAIVVFFLTLLLFDDWRAGLVGALLFSLIPVGLIWSNTTAAEPSTALVAGLALLSVALFNRRRDNHSLFLSVVILSFACQFRPESVLVLIPAGALLFFYAPEELLTRRTPGFVLLFVTLLLPHVIHLYAVRGEEWGAPSGGKFAVEYFWVNFKVNLFYYFNNKHLPVVFTLLAIVGMMMPISRSSKTAGRERSFMYKPKLVMALWFLPMWGIFLFFYAGSYAYGADERFAVVSLMPLSVLGGYGGFALASAVARRFNARWAYSGITLLIVFSWLSFLPWIRATTQEAWGARADHQFAEAMAETLPENSMVLTHNPSMFLLWGKNAAQSFLAIEPDQMRGLFLRYPGGVFFHYNYWCNAIDDEQQSICNTILDQFRAKKVISFRKENFTYALYQLFEQQPVETLKRDAIWPHLPSREDPHTDTKNGHEASNWVR